MVKIGMKKLRIIMMLISVCAITTAIALLCGCNNQTDTEFYNVIYAASRGGYISGEFEQIIERGNNTLSVTAIPYDGYEFAQWSDGTETAERQDKNVISDLYVTAQFKKKASDEPNPIKEYTITYTAGVGGYIEGATVQTINENESAKEVVAVPNEGYKFVQWSDGLTAPERQDGNIIKNQLITAKFEKITFTVRYECKKGMLSVTTASGKTYGGQNVDFEVNYGDDCEKIISVETLEDTNQRFIGWSDGVETEERQEKNVTSDITIRAKFGYELTYKVESGKGRIESNSSQFVEDGEDSIPVTAIADDGYVFSGWSDMVMSETHKLTYKMVRNEEYVAYFELIEKTFKYDYGFATPIQTEITVNRNKLNEAQFEIPQRDGYVFRGWYADREYKLKAVHESGKLMLGLQTLNLETDTLYARWEKLGEEKKTYKILMIMVDEIYATLYSWEAQQDILVDYKMSGVERKFCSVVPFKISQYLNKWFEGRVIFEIDTYFTREVVGESSFARRTDTSGMKGYAIFGDRVKETDDIIEEYESSLLTFSMNDYESLLHDRNVAGSAGPKHGMFHIENKFYKNVPNQIMIEETINFNGYGLLDENSKGFPTVETYLHEFIHTIEQRYVSKDPKFEQYSEEVYEFHKSILMENTLEGYRLYLLKQQIKDGIIIGIPASYWETFYN